jgi:hypothetical protein
MSTRALYSFLGEDGNHNVYKHHDGYASGAARTLKMAIDLFAWPLPRYESDAFAAAFVAAGKFGSWIDNKEDLDRWYADYGPNGQYKKFGGNGGGVRLMPQGDPCAIAQKNCSDIQYRYEIRMKRNKLHVKCFSGSWWGDMPDHPQHETVEFDGKFDDFYNWAMKEVEAA